MKYLKNNKGSSIISYIVIVAITVYIAIAIIPRFYEASQNRSERIINVFNSTDTLVE